MKIEFNNVGTVNEKIDSLSNIHLCSKNLRYSLTLPNVDLFSFISSDDTNKKENEIVMDILNHEGDLNNLCTLFESMYANGFDSNEGTIVLVKPQNNDNTFIVAEGNRRIASLKLLAKDIEMPSLDQLYFYKNTTNEKDKNNCKKNYEKINNLITKINTKFTNFTIAYTIIDSKVNRCDPQKLRSFIFNKHMPGPRPGMRQWPRGHYFALLLKYFPKGFDHTKIKEFQDKAWILLRRTLKSVLPDFKSAQFVMHVIKAGEDTLNTKEVYKKMSLDGQVSALEPKFCLKHIKKSASQYIDINCFEDDYFKYEFDDNGVIRFVKDGKKIPYKKMLKFIYKQYTNKILTTRAIRPEKINEFNLALLHLLESTEIKNIKTPKDWYTADFLTYSISELDELGKKVKKIDDVDTNIIIDRITTSKNVIKNMKVLNNLMNKLIKNIETKNEGKSWYVFLRLYEQCIYNIKPSIPFLHAIAATIRAILEQYFIWAAYYYDSDNFLDGFYKYIKQPCPKNKNSTYIELLANGQNISRTFSYIKSQFFKDLGQAIEFIEKILLPNKQENTQIAQSLVDNIDDINQVLNECIHSSHRNGNNPRDSKYYKYCKSITTWQIILINIMENLDNSKIEQINNELQKLINKY